MHLNDFVLTSAILGGALCALASGCSGENRAELTSDQQASVEDLSRHCQTADGDADWAERCAAWLAKRSDAGAKDASPAPAPSPTTTTTAPPPPPAPTPTTTTTAPPPPAPVTCTSFVYSAWGTCQSTGTQTRTVVSSSPAGCTGGTPVLSQACVYTAPIDGGALYTQYCAGCHGTSKKGSSATNIQAAIDKNTGGMGSLSFLTPAQVAAIAAAP